MAGRVGFDAVGQAMSGVVRLTGTPDQPYRAQVNYVDFGTALHGAFGAMVALRERDRTGQGQQVSGSLLGTATAMAQLWFWAHRCICDQRRLDYHAGGEQPHFRALGAAGRRARTDR